MPIPRDPRHDVLIVIPTVARPSVLIQSFDLLCRRLDGLRVHVVLSINPLTKEDGEQSLIECGKLWMAYKEKNPGCHLTIYNHEQPAGFGGAINWGIRAAIGEQSMTVVQWGDNHLPMKTLNISHTSIASGVQAYGVPPLTVIWNDDLRVTDGWLRGMLAALQSKVVEDWAEVPNQTTFRRPQRSMADYVGVKAIGLIGPMTNCAAGMQQIPQESVEQYKEVGAERFAVLWRERFSGCVLTANFLSGYCMGITYDCLSALATYTANGSTTSLRISQNEVHMSVAPGSMAEPRFAWLFNESYVVAGYEDNDLCMRADLAGYRAVVDASTFIGHVGHQTFDAAFPEMGRGMRNRKVYYDNWSWFTQRKAQSIVGAYRIKLEVPNDIEMLRMSLVRHGGLLNDVVILLTGNPADVLKSAEAQSMGMNGLISKLGERDYKMLEECSLALGVLGVSEIFGKWAQRWLAQDLPSTPSLKPYVTCDCWVGEFNERVERNYLLKMAEAAGADWILSIDHDEAIEPRITRKHLDRIIRHPDPLVSSWDLAFVNHWENNRMYRVDRPWGDGGTWTGGMRGYRLVRVNHVNPRYILAGGHNGLHCGNVPGTDWSTKRTAGIRMRHFGYMHFADRNRKERRYNVQDPHPDPLLVGGNSYAHITADSEMVLSPFSAENGIGLHMLLHSGEDEGDIARILDDLYGLVDRIVLVWTDDKPISFSMLGMCEHFKAEFIEHPLADNIAEARNAGINALQGTPGMGWSLFLDPDEHMPMQGAAYIRRMAEANDCWAWMFRFVNKMGSGDSNWSESIRLARLDSEGIMRMTGRVHESFQPAIKQLRSRGLGRVVRVAPDAMVTMNTGLSRTPEEMQRKLEFYRRLVELELNENPNNAGAWTTLGLYWANMGAMRTAEECFARGIQCADTEYLPYQELGLMYARRAKVCFSEAAQRMGGHRMRSSWEKLVDILETAAPEMPRLGSATADGFTPVDDQEGIALLPPPPVEKTDSQLPE